jgi:hypothetical protein
MYISAVVTPGRSISLMFTSWLVIDTALSYSREA